MIAIKMPVLELFHISLRCQKFPKISFQEELFFPFKMSLGHEFVFNVDWNGKHGHSHSRWRNKERYFLWHWTRRGKERNEEWKTAILIHRMQTWSGHHIKVALGNFHIDWLRTWKKTTTIHNQVNEWTGMFAKLVFRNRFGPWPTAQLQHDLIYIEEERKKEEITYPDENHQIAECNNNSFTKWRINRFFKCFNSFKPTGRNLGPRRRRCEEFSTGSGSVRCWIRGMCWMRQLCGQIMGKLAGQWRLPN